jgi:uncharacterized protein GlcG (DUF336 family)
LTAPRKFRQLSVFEFFPRFEVCMRHPLSLFVFGFLFAAASGSPALAATPTCKDLPTHATLKAALTEARKQTNGGLNNDIWGTIIDRSGLVCAVAYTGESIDAQWTGARILSAQKANTANAFSIKGHALSTANLFSAIQSGGPLFGLQESNPVDMRVAYDGNFEIFGLPHDPMVGKRIGGTNAFGGGLPLYNKNGDLVGGIGIAGDSSCADHNIAWRARHELKLDFSLGLGVGADKSDNIIYDIKDGKSASGYGHPTCDGTAAKISTTLNAPQKSAAPLAETPSAPAETKKP